MSILFSDLLQFPSDCVVGDNDATPDQMCENMSPANESQDQNAATLPRSTAPSINLNTSVVLNVCFADKLLHAVSFIEPWH